MSSAPTTTSVPWSVSIERSCESDDVLTMSTMRS